MSRFISQIAASNGDIKQTRAKGLAASAELEATTLVQNLTREVLRLEAKIEDLSDLAPDTTHSLKLGGDNFNPAQWVKDMHETEMELMLKNVELTSAKKLYAKWFVDKVEATDQVTEA